MININRKRLIFRYLDQIVEHLEGLTEYVFKSETILKVSDANPKSIQERNKNYLY